MKKRKITETIYEDRFGIPLVPVLSREIAAGKTVAKSHAGTGCKCGACQRFGGEFRPLSKTKIKKPASIFKMLAVTMALAEGDQP